MLKPLDSIIATTSPWNGGHPLRAPGPWEAVWALPQEDCWAVAIGRRRVLEVGRVASPQDLISLVASTQRSIRGLPEQVPGPWFGGMAFDPLRFEARGEWEGFAATRWVLPRALIWRHGGKTFCTRFDAEGEEPSRAPEPTSAPGHFAPQIIGSQDDRASYEAVVAEAVSAIGRGALEKVVLARSADLSLSAPPLLETVLTQLGQRYPSCRLFLFRGNDGSVFCGSTPETLCRVAGQALETDVLAGSRPPSSPEFNTKERAEHDVVAKALIQALRRLALRVEPMEPPSVRALANILHLHSRLRATLRPEVSPAQLLLELHPTPAVGGFPRESARRFITEHENLPRGWYAGPVGVLGPGTMDLSVALRCAWVHGARARLFMGAGIVRGSMPSAEWEETERKSTPMREALAGGAS